MDTKEFLDTVCSEVKYKPATKMISDELEGHIEDLKNENLCKGDTNEQAEEKAIEQMGDAKKIGKKLNKIHRPKLDWITLILMIALILFGGKYIKLLYPDVFWGKGFAGVNDLITNKVEYIAYICVIIFCIGLYFYDYRKICKHSKAFYLFATVLNITAYMKGFRANGNLIHGLWPFTSVSPTVFSIPLYIIAFAGFIEDINKESKTSITMSHQIKDNSNLIKIIILSISSVIISLMINFVSGFLLAMVYGIILTRELLNRKQFRSMIIFLVGSIILFSLLSMIICIIPTKWANSDDELFSAYWVGVDTKGEREIDFERNETVKSAKLFGQADLGMISYGEYESRAINYFGTTGNFAFLGILSRYGWIASIGFASFLLLFNIRLISSACKIKDTYGKVIAIGISSLYLVQIICNLAMNFGIIGVAEFNIPFISVGDAEFLIDILFMSLFLSVYRRKDINFEEPKKSKLVAKVVDFFFEEAET